MMKTLCGINRRLGIGLLLLCAISVVSGRAQSLSPEALQHPRLLMTKSDEAIIRTAVAHSRQWAIVDSLLMKGATDILPLPAAERVVIGRRLLDVSRETLRRIFLLGYAYRMTGESRYALRAEKELTAVADFTDWNPSHFLDVAEMTTAVAIGYDWFHSVLPDEVKTRLKTAIWEKGLLPSFEERYNNWLHRVNNWNQVCNTGMAYGAIATYEDRPSLADSVIKRSVESVKKPMKAYAPDGAYPEGYSYWGFGTTYNVMLIDALEKSFGTDFGLSAQEGFLDTPAFILHMVAPDKDSFNYGDNKDSGRLSPAMFWFANRKKDTSLLWNERILFKEGNKKKLIDYRFFTLSILWGAAVDFENLPKPADYMWVSPNSPTPVALMRTSWERKKGLFLAFKGGSAQTSHAHLDVGSFVMVADGERWAMDFGRQDYHSLESKGIDLWNKAQDSQRWKVFRYNNSAHNTLTFDGRLQDVKGYASIDTHGSKPGFSFAVSDITPVYVGQIGKARRGVALVKEKYVVVRDELVGGEKETTVRWSMLTPATVERKDSRTMLLTIGDKRMEMRVESPVSIELKTWSTAPTTDYDAENPGTTLVGFEARIPARSRCVLQVKLIPSKGGPATDEIGELDTWNNP